MRDFIVIFVILSVVFGGNYVQNNYFDKSTKDLLDVINKMEENMELPKDEKKKIVQELLDKWEGYEKPWIALQYHQNINEIEDIVIECYTFYLEGDETHFLLNARKLNRNLDDMKNRERISLVNVL
ncbi:MAG: DUF4363 family protein [Clostridia bacterium]|nr:DUF4363 family protein [Clostridia bacterium]